MSSKLRIKFQTNTGVFIDDFPVSVKHLRNTSISDTGKLEVTQKGGYTVVSDWFGNMFVSRCHPKHDIFCRKTGLFEAISKLVRLNWKDMNGKLETLAADPTNPSGLVATITLGASA